MGKDVIIACDFPNKEETLSFLSKFTDEKPYLCRTLHLGKRNIVGCYASNSVLCRYRSGGRSCGIHDRRFWNT